LPRSALAPPDADADIDMVDISFTIVFSISSEVADGFILVNFLGSFLGALVAIVG
jgi:hypothetical protein